MKKLLILDFDGTLGDTRELIVATNQAAMRQMHYPVRDEATIAATIGLPLEEGILTMYPDLPREMMPRWVEAYRSTFERLRTQIVPQVFPQVQQTLRALHEAGHPISVASSRLSPSLNRFLVDMGLSPYIGFVLGADNVKQAKPHPEPVLKTLRDLHYAPQDALVVGDMPVDIQMGLGAGAWTCGVTYGNSNREDLLAAGAHFVVDSFSGIPSILASISDTEMPFFNAKFSK